MTSTNFRPEIQGLRAIAVLAVMAFHYNPALLPGGFVGVDVFLVISGFLITSILLKKKAKANYTLTEALKNFYISRFKRIAPAYFLMLVLVAMVAAVLFLPQDFDIFKEGLEKAAWFNSNNYFAGFGNYFAPSNNEQPLLHTWSLAVEVQFYLLAPFLVLLLPIKALKWVFVSLLIGLTLFAEYRLRLAGIELATYYNFFARMPEFFAGGLAALYVTTVPGVGLKDAPWRTNLGLALILLASIAQPVLGPFPGLAALLPVAGSVLILSSSPKGLVRRVLYSKVLVFLGSLSYSLYLWHWPVLAFLRYYSGTESLDLSLTLIFILLTLSLSVGSFYGVERAFRSKQSAKKQAIRWGTLLFAVMGTPQAMAKVHKTFTPEQLSIEYRRYADPATICHGNIVGDCLKGDLNSEKAVLVLGDSHAAMLNHFFDHLGKELGFKARVITASSCVTFPGFDYQRISKWAHQPCLDQIEVAKPYIEQTQTILIAGSWSWHTESETFNRALEEFLKNQIDKQIFILSQVPRFKNNVNRVRRFEGLGLPTHLERDLSYQVANTNLIELVNNYANVDFKALDALPFFDQAPYYRGKLIYFDAHHINQVGAGNYGASAIPFFLEFVAQQPD